MAPLNNSSHERVQLKIAGYPDRAYYGKIDPGKVDTINLDFSRLYKDKDIQNTEKRAIDYTKRTSINLIGVKKEKNPEKKPHFYDVENLTLSYSLNETQHHDYEIENLIDQQNRSTVDYAFSFKPLTVEPFKETKAFKKSNYYKKK